MVPEAVAAGDSEALFKSGGVDVGATRCIKLSTIMVGVGVRQWGSTALVNFRRRILWLFQAATSRGQGVASHTPPL